MKSLAKEELVPLTKCLDELLSFIRGLQVEEIPYFYRFLENMRYNLEICFLVQYEGWEQIEQILRRDWKAANHMLIGIPGFSICADSAFRKAELECRFIELIANIERYL